MYISYCVTGTLPHRHRAAQASSTALDGPAGAGLAAPQGNSMGLLLTGGGAHWPRAASLTSLPAACTRPRVASAAAHAAAPHGGACIWGRWDSSGRAVMVSAAGPMGRGLARYPPLRAMGFAAPRRRHRT